jgi:hypothetical protein
MGVKVEEEKLKIRPCLRCGKDFKTYKHLRVCGFCKQLPTYIDLSSSGKTEFGKPDGRVDTRHK